MNRAVELRERQHGGSGSWLNDTVVILLPPHPLEVTDRRLGRPSVPIDTLLRLLYLKHRYQLDYESLCREVADSISWRRICRIGLDRPVPHPTTLVKLVRRAGRRGSPSSTARCWTSSRRTSCGVASCG
jgi:Transposase domain (DUF772)